MLRQLSKQMQEQSAAAKAAKEAAEELRKNPKGSPEALQKALDEMKEKEEGLDSESLSKRKQTAEDLEKLRLADEMLAQAERLQSMVQQQRDLAGRMAELRDLESLTPEQQERARQLAKEQELLEQELSETTEELEKLSGQCEKCLPKTSADAKKLCQAIRDGQITGDQQSAAKNARGGKGKDAAARAEEAARKLEALQCESCNAEGMGGEMDLDGGLKLSKAGAKQSLKQLAQGRQVPGMKPRTVARSPGEFGQWSGRFTQPGDDRRAASAERRNEGIARTAVWAKAAVAAATRPTRESFAAGPESIDPAVPHQPHHLRRQPPRRPRAISRSGRGVLQTTGRGASWEVTVIGCRNARSSAFGNAPARDFIGIDQIPGGRGGVFHRRGSQRACDRSLVPPESVVDGVLG